MPTPALQYRSGRADEAGDRECALAPEMLLLRLSRSRDHCAGNWLGASARRERSVKTVICVSLDCENECGCSTMDAVRKQITSHADHV